MTDHKEAQMRTILGVDPTRLDWIGVSDIISNRDKEVE